MGDKGRKDKDKLRKQKRNKQEAGEATETDALTESTVKCPPDACGQHRRVP